MNFAANIAYFATGTYTVHRRGPTTAAVDGLAVVASETTFAITASVQPGSGESGEQLTEGERISNIKEIWTTTLLRAGKAADKVDIGGTLYRVTDVKDNMILGGFCTATAIREGD